MSGFVEEVRSISSCVEAVAEALRFPWEGRLMRTNLMDAMYLRAGAEVRAQTPYPPFARSLRDGYALHHGYTTGASSGAPVFLRLAGAVEMGVAAEVAVQGEATVAIPTGGMLPEGADAVVMIEDTSEAGGLIEIRRSVQRGDNVVFAGEELRQGDVLLHAGDQIDASVFGLLATMGVTSVSTLDLRVGVLSTGDEIVPADVADPELGCIRDANSYIVRALLERYGFPAQDYGIVRDDAEALARAVARAREECDVVLISGGSSVGVRDHTAGMMQASGNPGLLVRGINMAPGKPTLIAGELAEKKLLLGLPGHPLSCSVVCLFVLLPLLLRLCGSRSTEVGRALRLPLGGDVSGRTGPEEFVPMRLADGAAFPAAAKSGYVAAMRDCDGFIRLGPNVETLRRGEVADVWIW